MSTATQGAALAVVTEGALRGTREAGVAVFRNVPYAAAPVGPLRFQPPAPAPQWAGERDASRHGAIAPQPPSRLRAAMGDFSHPQSEDCLTVTVWTPAADQARRPVLVWLHGGAFMSGAGSLPWYSGAVMAQRGNMVVVGVNYRLGALGFMHLPGVSAPNLGLLDQFCALDWVSRNITAFGGDPDNITVAGQSAGGFSVLAMLAVPRVRVQFRRAIAQSAPFGRVMRPPAAAAENAQRMQGLLGLKSAADWLAVSTTDIVAAQVKLTIATAEFANAVPPFGPVADGVLFGDDLLPAALAGAAERDLLLGHTRDEMAAFFAIDERVKNAAPDAIEGRFRAHFGAGAEPALNEYRQRARSPSPMHLLGEMAGDALFNGGCFAFAERVAALGRPAHVFRFDWAAADNPFSACHCIELPFVFNNLGHWSAPMLDGGDPAAMATLATRMQDAWIAFARAGDPSHPGLPAWPRFGQATREVMLLDAAPGVRNDPAGRARWHYWP